MSLLDGKEHEVGFRMDAPQGLFQVQCWVDVEHRWVVIHACGGVL